MVNKYLFNFIVLLWICASCATSENKILVSSEIEFERAVKAIKKGEKIVLQNGVWKNVELVFKGVRTKEFPITLTAEEPGKVIISGQSNLQISGEYLIVSGLVFKNGYTPTSEVISFKTGKDELANHSRVTNCVIDNFTNPERFDGDT